MSSQDFISTYELPVSESRKPTMLWIDIETTGLDNDRDVILEIGLIGTDNEGHVIPGMVWESLIWEASDHYRDRFDNMDDFVQKMHLASGLLEEMASDPDDFMSLNSAENSILTFLHNREIQKGQLYLAGSSVHFDNGFLEHYMHKIPDFLNYRQINVSTLKVLCQELNPELYAKIQKTTLPMKRHRSLPDLVDSLHEWYAYRDNFLFLPSEDELSLDGS